MKLPLIILAAALLSGCASLNHRIACTAAKDEALLIVDAKFARVALSANDADRKAICTAPAPAAPAPAAAASGAK
jgi:uncharacterized protein YceK